MLWCIIHPHVSDCFHRNNVMICLRILCCVNVLMLPISPGGGIRTFWSCWFLLDFFLVCVGMLAVVVAPMLTGCWLFADCAPQNYITLRQEFGEKASAGHTSRKNASFAALPCQWFSSKVVALIWLVSRNYWSYAACACWDWLVFYEWLGVSRRVVPNLLWEGLMRIHENLPTGCWVE